MEIFINCTIFHTELKAQRLLGKLERRLQGRDQEQVLGVPEDAEGTGPQPDLLDPRRDCLHRTAEERVGRARTDTLRALKGDRVEYRSQARQPANSRLHLRGHGPEAPKRRNEEPDHPSPRHQHHRRR